jgi:hypothetical protein
MPRLYVTLIHYPVVNKQGDCIASAVTNLDLHDIARAVKTYGGLGFYVATPLTDQKVLVERIVSHWTSGVGGEHHPKRKQALELIHVADSLEAVCEDIGRREGMAPITVITSAKQRDGNLSFTELRTVLESETPVLLVFGTAWGLAEDVISQADYSLTPIDAQTGYNHLSVRCAAAIIMDRLLGNVHPEMAIKEGFVPIPSECNRYK